MIHFKRRIKIALPWESPYLHCKTLKCGCVVNMFNQINIKKDSCFVWGWP
jgi:hypothetical protein